MPGYGERRKMEASVTMCCKRSKKRGMYMGLDKCDTTWFGSEKGHKAPK